MSLYDVRHRENGETARVFSPRNFYQLREQAASFESTMAQVALNINLLEREIPERIVGVGVSDQWLSTPGVEPVKGRRFTREEERGRDSSGAQGRCGGIAGASGVEREVSNRTRKRLARVARRGGAFFKAVAVPDGAFARIVGQFKVLR